MAVCNTQGRDLLGYKRLVRVPKLQGICVPPLHRGTLRAEKTH